MNYDHAVNQIVELAKNAPNETDTRVEAKRILKEFVNELAHEAETRVLTGHIEWDDDDIVSLKIGGTD